MISSYQVGPEKLTATHTATDFSADQHSQWSAGNAAPERTIELDGGAGHLLGALYNRQAVVLAGGDSNHRAGKYLHCSERRICSIMKYIVAVALPLSNCKTALIHNPRTATRWIRLLEGKAGAPSALLTHSLLGTTRSTLHCTLLATASASRDVCRPLSERTLPEVGTAALRDEPTKLLRSAEAIFPVQGRVEAQSKL